MKLSGLFAAVFACALVSYGPAMGDPPPPAPSGPVVASPAIDGDMTIGSATAKVEIIEYASLACPHCAEWHTTVWDQLKANYIDTGKIRFTLREFPTAAPADIVLAEFQVARCGGATASEYFDRVAIMMRERETIFSTLTREGIHQQLIAMGARFGLSQQQVDACIQDQAGANRFNQATARGEHDIVGTPSFFIDGVRSDNFQDWATYDAFAHTIDAEIARRH
ncbi:MAG: thioredoxin domain-containing protein [Pseudomonadota bacterium]